MQQRELVWVDGVWTAGVNAGASMQVTVTPAWPDSVNRAHLIVVFGMDTLTTDNSPASVTVGGVAATQLIAKDSLSSVYLYLFKQPPKAAHNVVVTFVESLVNGFLFIAELEGCDPTVAGLVAQVVGAVGTATSSTLSLPSVQDGGYLLQAVTLWLATLTTTATPVSPFSSQSTGITGSSPYRSRVAVSDVQQPAAGNFSPQYNFAASKPFAHAAVEVRGEPMFPMAASMGYGF